MPTADAIIIGQGLAGSALAWRLEECGFSCFVIDRGGIDAAGAPSASRVAAGLITPVTGKRLTIARDWPELSAAAADFYRKIETRTDASFFSQKPALRVLDSSNESARFAARRAEPRFAAEAGVALPDDTPDLLSCEHGCFWMPNAARLAVRAYLEATRLWLASKNRYFEANIDPERDVDIAPGGVRAPTLGISASVIVLCQGHTPEPAPWLPQARLAPAKGEVITVRSPELRLRSVVHRGVWVAPETGVDGEYLVGSTHGWDRLDAEPTPEARAALCESLGRVVRTPFEVMGQAAAVRPATSDRQPLVGLSATHPRLGWLNGLGSKGALMAPWHASRLAKMLQPLIRKG